MKRLLLGFCALFLPLVGVAQEEVPHRVDTNYVGKPATEADKLLGKADEAFDNEDYDTAFQYYQKAAEAGNIDAYTGLGRCYAYGLGVAFNAQNALHWYQKAAYAGSALGNTILAFFILKVGTVKNPIRKRA